MDWDKLADELIDQAYHQGEVGRSSGSSEAQQAAGLAAQQTLYGIANAIKKALA